MILFQNQKLEKELNDLQGVSIFLSHPLFLNKEGQISKKWVEGQLHSSSGNISLNLVV